MSDKPKKGKKGKKKGFQLADAAPVAPPPAPVAAPAPAPVAAEAPASPSPAVDPVPTAAAAVPAADAPSPKASEPPAAPAGAGAGATASPAATKLAVEEFEHEETKETCRLYEKDFPDVDEVVMVLVKSFKRDDPGAVAELLEYDGLEGMILTSELSKRRIRSVYKLLTVGSIEPVKVLRVNRDKGYIDLSKRQADPDEKRAAQERYQRAKSARVVFTNAARKLGTSLHSLYDTVAWPLARKYGHALAGLGESVSNESVLTSLEGVDERTAQVIRNLSRRRLAPKAVTLTVELQLTCFEEIGIQAIQSALIAAKECSADGMTISAKVLAAPHYILSVNSPDPEAGTAILQKAIDSAKADLTANGGKLLAEEIKVPEQETLLSDSEHEED